MTARPTAPTSPKLPAGQSLAAASCSVSFLSVCSGIEAASVAWEPLGWKACGFAEIEPFPSAVLAHHWPDVPNLGDMTKHDEWPTDLRPDVVVGGTPCQAFSVAGLRQGLADPRGNLTLTFLSILEQYRPTWVVWENVPGVLSDKTGAFGAFLGGLGELGYGFAYRVLDAQYFGVPQRRRRVFVVGHLGDWRRAAAVLFERESLQGNPPPRREKGQGVAAGVAPCIGASGRGFARTGETRGQDCVIPEVAHARMVAFGEYVDDGTASSMKARDYKDATDLVAHTLRPEHDASEDGTGRGTPIVPVAFQQNTRDEEQTMVAIQDGRDMQKAQNGTGINPSGIAYTVDTTGAQAIAFERRMVRTTGGPPQEELNHCLRSDANTGDGAPCVAFTTRGREGGLSVECQEELAYALKNPGAGGRSNDRMIATPYAVRRLTPTECERLQGFPDGHTLIPGRYRHRKPGDRSETIANLLSLGWSMEWAEALADSPDGPRYKALGNSMAVPVMRWIGERISRLNDQSAGTAPRAKSRP